ncbi:hypothetical protein SAMN05444280_1153 [Tangfeifania diversioriginum]|uniref:Uncharacterized protein n=1 Tax=Tangfeifania diversioriginum TaxID=1168035 RepID=A0A1M6HYK4_9BACT|nr:hypothetical protein SAMN05444280_1153 [Tangfeifania diversioriginum]
MKPEDNRKIRNFKERNKYIEGVQYYIPDGVN